MGRSTDSILIRESLSSWVITVKVMELQKWLLEPWKFLSRFFNTFTSEDKYSLISRDNWMHTIQMHLSRKQKSFPKFFSAFFEPALNFEHFQKKSMFLVMYFRNYRPRKTCLDKCLKAPVSENPLTGDMVSGQKHWFKINQSAFIISSDHSEGNGVAKVTLRDVKIF